VCSSAAPELPRQLLVAEVVRPPVVVVASSIRPASLSTPPGAEFCLMLLGGCIRLAMMLAPSPVRDHQ
jgi:hypothetical protein